VSNRLKILVYSVLTMTVITMVVGIVAIYVLYTAAFNLQAHRLVEIAKAQARLIEAVARFDRRTVAETGATGGGQTDAEAATLSQVVDAHRNFAGFGDTGEVVLARLENVHIVFLLERRHQAADLAPRIPFAGSTLAEPMRRALGGSSGMIVGLDYRGERVIAAHEPVGELNLGIVAKIDVREIRRPFIKAGLLTGAIGALCILGGGLLMVGVNNPLITRVEARMRSILDTAADAIITIDSAGFMQSFNPAAERMFGYKAAEVLGRNVKMLMPSPYRGEHDTYLNNYLTTGVRKIIGIGREVEGQRKDGSTFPIDLAVSEVQHGNEHTFTGIARDISAKKAAEEQLQQLIQQLTAASQELESMMTAQVTSTHQVVATAKEIAATSQDLVQTMHNVTSMSADTATAAESGQTSLTSMETTMETMEGATRTIADRLGVINERAANITSVVTTISKVAEQTNLLSLNATIEAEKAGEHGLGFAVVAREIRRLADQTAEATLDIEHIVKEMTSAISSGVVGMDQFAQEVHQGTEEIRTVGVQLAQIITQVQRLTPRFDIVHEGMQAQAQGAQQINEAMVQLSGAAQQTVESLRGSTRAIAQLHQVSEGLHDGRARLHAESAPL
jgi:PAS domain S-box-containing protein